MTTAQTSSDTRSPGPSSQAPFSQVPPSQAPPSAERIPPQSLEAEMSLLGSMMLSREAVGDVIPIISISELRWFYRPDHQVLFSALVDLYDTNEPIDLVILREALNRRGELEQVGGVNYLMACAESVPTHVNAEHYARIVRDKGILRDLIACVGNIADDAYGDSGNTADLLDRAEQRLFGVTERRISGQSVPIGELVKIIAKQFEPGAEHKPVGLPSGFFDLDELTTGFQPGDFIIVAGRPSMGKTALGLTMAEFMAVDEERPSVFFSMEMSRQQVAQRLICSRARIDSHKFRKFMLSGEDKEKLSFCCGQFQDVALFVDDTPGMTALELRAKARRLKHQHDIQAVFVDYIQLMHTPGAESRQQEIATISRALKGLGRELNIPVIAMAQLNRSSEGREGHRPRMSDLRESGAIEQDADVVLLLHRDEYYKPDDPEVKNMADLIIAKQRNGPTATVKLVFNHQLTRFENFSPVPDPGYISPDDEATPF